MLKIMALTGLALAALTGAACAADFVQPTSAIATTDWTGFYAGVNIGYGPGTVISTDEDFWVSQNSFGFQGLTAGGQIGYNTSVGNGVVIGVEGDLDWANETGGAVRTSGTDTDYTNTHVDWTGALTGHVGMPIGSFMPYVLGGIAFAHNTINGGFDQPGDHYHGSTSNWQTGFTIGAGAALQLSENISAFGEVRYADYGIADYDGSTSTGADVGPVSVTDTSVRAGLNFHF